MKTLEQLVKEFNNYIEENIESNEHLIEGFIEDREFDNISYTEGWLNCLKAIKNSAFYCLMKDGANNAQCINEYSSLEELKEKMDRPTLKEYFYRQGFVKSVDIDETSRYIEEILIPYLK